MKKLTIFTLTGLALLATMNPLQALKITPTGSDKSDLAYAEAFFKSGKLNKESQSGLVYVTTPNDNGKYPLKVTQTWKTIGKTSTLNALGENALVFDNPKKTSPIEWQSDCRVFNKMAMDLGGVDNSVFDVKNVQRVYVISRPQPQAPNLGERLETTVHKYLKTKEGIVQQDNK